MEVIKTPLPGVLVFKPRIFTDDRGHFFEGYNQREYAEYLGNVSFVQDNVSRSLRGVLRGLHFQNPRPQGKLVRVLRGEIFDVVVDIRRASPSFGGNFSTRLSADNALMIWIPRGFAHGFLTLSETADILYKTTDFYMPAAEHCIAWNDPHLGIDWPLSAPALLSPKDAAGKSLQDSEVFP